MTNHYELILRPTIAADLEHLFLFQLDPEANYLAAFTPKDELDKAAYIQKHLPFLSNPSINNQTILINGIIAGSIAKFEIDGEAEITYWIDSALWGKGVATAALQQFLSIEHMRPISARVAFDNLGSQRVLEKAGFIKVSTDKGFANARQAEIEEFIYKLD
ncbi:GNAT family N-acetyltransferase [Mucilaginibacter koreensis]